MENIETTENAEELRREQIYSKAVVSMRGIKNAELQQRAIDLFRTIPGWRDADERIAVCEQRIKAIREKEEAERAEKERAAKKRKRAAVITLCSVVLCAAFAVLLFTVLLPLARYNKAKSLYEAGRFEEAAAAFEAMGGYRDSKEMITECAYSAADALFTAEEYEEAAAAFEALGDHRDSAARVEACLIANRDKQYASALALYEAGEYEKAYPAFTALDGYLESAKLAAEIYDDYKAARLYNAGVGEYLIFGSYEQDNDPDDGKEDIEWLVLNREEDRVLVVSRYILDFKQYNSNDASVSWETCSIRRWLNNDFLNEAFTPEEQRAIQPTVASFEKDSTEEPPEGEPVDMVYLMSQSEVYKYFDSDEARKCSPTDYAIAQGARTGSVLTSEGKPSGWWWLRLHAESNWHAACVNLDGSVYHLDLILELAYDGVRPAMWIDTSGN